jgi:hypothetical protein
MSFLKKIESNYQILATELWQMTKQEYEQKHGKPKANTTKTGGFSAHKSAVEVALNKGLPVPEKVLKDYPDLQKEHVPNSHEWVKK